MINNKTQIESLYKKYSYGDASHGFLPLFVYENSYSELILTDNGYSARFPDGFLCPVGDAEFKAEFIEKHKDEPFICIPEPELPLFSESETVEDGARFEYVYDRVEQNTLPGHKFSRVRSKLSKFSRENDCVTVAITEDNLPDAYKILSLWQPKGGEGDFAGAKASLDNFFNLGLLGAISYIGGESAAYVCGGELTDDTFVLIGAKQIYDIQGLNIRTKYDFFQTLPERFKFINTESDHGEPGIREHKLDLRPCRLLKLYKTKTE